MSEPEISENEQSAPQTTPATKQRKQAPRFMDQKQNQEVARRHVDPESAEARRDATMKSRIKDRQESAAAKRSRKIKIELDLEAEVNLYARVKGDVTIGLL